MTPASVKSAATSRVSRLSMVDRMPTVNKVVQLIKIFRPILTYIFMKYNENQYYADFESSMTVPYLLRYSCYAAGAM